MTAFTALNGGEPKPADPSVSPTTKRVDSEERQAPVSATHEQRTSGETSSAPRENWSGASGDRSSYQPATHAEAEGSHKRRRSNSPEARTERQERSERPERPRSADEDRGQHTYSESRDPYSSSSRNRDYRPYGDEGREHSESWYTPHHRDDRGGYEQQNSAGSVPSQTEEQIGESFRGASDADQNTSPTSPDGDDYYGPEHRRDGSLVQSDPKRRKRNFSNRTKTGCLTCRKRKKKCDETKPECNNCLRGGFICQGYPHQRNFQKAENKPSAVPLESKDPSYVPPGAFGMRQQPQAAPFAQPGAPPKRDPLYSRGQPLRIDPPQGRPVLTDDDRLTASTIPTASVTSPDLKLSALSAYTSAANVFPTPISAISTAGTNFGPKDYTRMPPLHDTSRNEPETPHPGGPLPQMTPQINIMNPTRSSSPANLPPQTSNPQVAAQLALSHSHFPSRIPTQKELMLQGQPYRALDKELLLERERCSAACWRFNNSMNPNNGISAAERLRLFREIVQPKEPVNMSPSQQSPVSNTGRVGSDAVIEAPFTCDYGYNITIGQNVFIGRNCTILDPCSVKIGNNVYIGPNVSLFAATLQTDPSKRMGTRSVHTGSAIIIEDEVFIGGGAIILPGKRVGKGSTVAAGSIVTNDVPPFTIVNGNPARVLRGATVAT